MKYLDFDKLKLIDEQEFKKTKPFPWMGIQGALTPSGFDRLVQEWPSLEQFRTTIGEYNKAGAVPHDRYELRSEVRPKLSQGWQEFIKELNGREYRTFLQRMLGCKRFELRFQWHVSLENSAVSPHADSSLKIGNHLLYFNTKEDWNESWGGELELYDSEEKFPDNSAPLRESFARIFSYPIIDNRSVIFASTNHSWHGVKALEAPEGAHRKLFTVVIEKPRLLKTRIKDFLLDTMRGQPRSIYGRNVINK